MRILIDGCVFSQSDQTEAVVFWRQLVSRLPAYLQEHQVFFLNRTASPVFPKLESFTNLFAPPVDFAQSAIEDRRLAALCRELRIDVFVSTYNTSAGAHVKSLFVLHQPASDCSSDSFLSEDPVLLSRDRAVEMASRYLVFPKGSADDLTAIEFPTNDRARGVARQQIPVSQTAAISDWQIVGEQLAAALRETFDCKPSASAGVRRASAEEKVKEEALSLKKLEQEAAIAAYAASRKPSGYVVRAYHVLKTPRKYLEYVVRLYQRMRQKSKP